VWSRVFDERGLGLVPSLWPRVEALLLARLRDAVPDSWDGLAVFAGLAEGVRKLETGLRELGALGSGGDDGGALSELVLNAEESFAHKARVARLARARALVLGEASRNSVVAAAQGGRVSEAAAGLVALADECLAHAAGSPSQRHAKVLCATARDVFELFRGLAPLRRSAALATPRDAMLFRNDCALLARAACTLGHKHVALGVVTVDLAPALFDMADAALAGELAARTEELEGVLGDCLAAGDDFTRAMERLDAVVREWAWVGGDDDVPAKELAGAVEGALVAAMGRASPLKSRQEAWTLRDRVAALSDALAQRGAAGGLSAVLASLEPHVSLPLFVNDLAGQWTPGLALGLARFLFQAESSAAEMKDAERRLM